MFFRFVSEFFVVVEEKKNRREKKKLNVTFSFLFVSRYFVHAFSKKNRPWRAQRGYDSDSCLTPLETPTSPHSALQEKTNNINAVARSLALASKPFVFFFSFVNSSFSLSPFSSQTHKKNQNNSAKSARTSRRPQRASKRPGRRLLCFGVAGTGCVFSFLFFFLFV